MEITMNIRLVYFVKSTRYDVIQVVVFSLILLQDYQVYHNVIIFTL